MGGMFGGGPKYTPPAPAPVPAPAPAPTIDAARQAQIKNDNMAERQGRASSILTSNEGDLSAPNTAKKSLLGS